MKQTALQWLEQEFIKLEATTGVHGVMYELIEKAKAMEKEQIKKAYLDGLFDGDEWHIASPEYYYNETYNTK